ncbi:MAG: sn-glycerol-1-phosphate dehydrogenase [Clostridia bacterium]|nr:sn-glycerol-1-phosphate dehydrogenase [Clostridia bacterium]
MKQFETLICECGETHSAFTSRVIAECGAIKKLPEAIYALGCRKPFLVADQNTFKAAGEEAASLLSGAEMLFSLYVFEKSPAPDERAVGTAIMHFDNTCDCIVGIGSGVINDICKLLASMAKLPYVIVATAPSMDGYASASSSMERHGVKVSLPTKCADMIIGDPDILIDAPLYLHLSGLGDMIAKYTSICEWRISSVINGEHYCERVAQMIREALKKCIDNADGLTKGDKTAALAVFEGLVIAGAAMNYAGTSRPASGVEHYFSHVWDMRALEFGTPAYTHGAQCAVATLIAIDIYDCLRKITPDLEKALDQAGKFDYDSYKLSLRALLGRSAEALIRLEEMKEGKYDPAKHAIRIARIVEKWDEICRIIDEELPDRTELTALMRKLGAPTTVRELGIDPANLPEVFEATRDIRDKYVLSRLVFDLGLTEEIKESLTKNHS